MAPKYHSVNFIDTGSFVTTSNKSILKTRKNINILQSPVLFSRCKFSTRAVMTVNTAVFVSGSGRSLENLLTYYDRGLLGEAKVVTVVSSKHGVKALEIAKKWSLPSIVVSPGHYPSNSEFSQALIDICSSYRVQLIVLAGWMHFFHIPASYQGRVINIHPSLIPSFCGKGFYGMKVHKAVLDFGVKITGCTVHFADNEYDHGPIIIQKAVDVLETDTVDTLAKRVFEAEKVALPEAVRLFSMNLLRVGSLPLCIGPNHSVLYM
jgi:phosphoribosylglycinamide formyltransferase-1